LHGPSPEERLEELDLVFSALAHRARRQILMTLRFRGGSMSAGDIAKRLAHTWPTTTRHLRVLEDAKLLTHEQRGRARIYHINPRKIQVIEEWLGWFAASAAGGEPASTSGTPDVEKVEPLGPRRDGMPMSDTETKFRALCASFPGSKDGPHFDATVFRVAGRIFASCEEESTGVLRIIVQLEPEHAAARLAHDARFARYPMQKGCVMFDAKSVRDWDEMKELVGESYALNAPARRASPATTAKKATAAKKAAPVKKAAPKKAPVKKAPARKSTAAPGKRR
jgi:DNA-binding transcriptional ArsR family regulator